MLLSIRNTCRNGLRFSARSAIFLTVWFFVESDTNAFASDREYGDIATLVSVGGMPERLSSIELQILKNKARKHQPIFIFIPGIMGSSLKNAAGEYIWGERNSNAVELNFLQNSQYLESEILNNIEIIRGFYSEDIYGNFSKILTDIDRTNLKIFISFSYDWRQPINVITEYFNSWLESGEVSQDIAGRKVIFIAHSFGGLILRDWLSRFHQKKPKHANGESIYIEKNIFVATPHLGSAKSISRIFSGVLFEKPQERLAMGGAAKKIEDIGVTFPSLFQLLPIQNCDIIMNSDFECSNFSIINTEDWIRYRLVEKLSQKYDVLQGVEGDFYMSKLSNLIDYHVNSKKCYELQNSIFVYSMDHDTVEKIEFSSGQEEKGIEFNEVSGSETGDEVVTKNSAACFDNNNEIHEKSERLRASGNHLSILNSSILLSMIRKLRRDHLKKYRNSWARILQDNPEILKKFALSGRFIDFPLDFGVNPSISSDYALVMNVNREINSYVQSSINSLPMARIFGSNSTEKVKQDKLVAIFGRSPEAKFAAELNLASTANKFAVVPEALPFDFAHNAKDALEIGVSHINSARKYLPTLNFDDSKFTSNLASLENTNGLILYNMGQKFVAREKLLQAKLYGSVLAERNFQALFSQGISQEE